MAEAACKAELKKRKIRWYSVQSAGLNAAEGAPMSAFAAEALKEAGIPYNAAFKSKAFTKKLLDEAYAVVCLTEDHRSALGYPPHVTSFFELTDTDIPDPVGQGIEVYRATLKTIRACLPEIIERVCTPFEE